LVDKPALTDINQFDVAVGSNGTGIAAWVEISHTEPDDAGVQHDSYALATSVRRN
jgi:hypothetical protein